MPQNNCKINLMLIWKAYCVISSATGATKIAINNAKTFRSSSNSAKPRQ